MFAGRSERTTASRASEDVYVPTWLADRVLRDGGDAAARRVLLVVDVGTGRLVATRALSPPDVDHSAMIAEFAAVQGTDGQGSFALRDLGSQDTGSRFIYLCMAATWSNDTLAYFTGRTFGKHPLHPVVSPKKTWEGFAGGAVGSVVAAYACHATFLPELGATEAIIYGLIMAPLVPLGDLAESLLKRSAGIKDSGSIIPGHGGLLDRIDALLFAVPWTYMVAYYAVGP